MYNPKLKSFVEFAWVKCFVPSLHSVWYGVCTLVLIVWILLYRRLDDIPEAEFEDGYYCEPEEEAQGHFASQGKPSYKFSTLSYILPTLFYFKALHYYIILCDISSWS